MSDSSSDPWSIPAPDSAPAQPALPYEPLPQPYQAQPYQAQPYQVQPYQPEPYSSQPGSPGPVIVQIAEIAVTSTTVYTPAGEIPLAGSQWQVSDFWHSHQRIPRWAIVAAVAGFCVLTVFSLLFLLVKENVLEGTVQITVTNGTRQYVARVPVTGQAQVAAINQQVNYVRSLAAL